MRGVIKSSQARAGCISKIDNVQRGRFLIEVISVAARIEPEQRAEQKPDRRFVRHNHNILSTMLAHEVDQDRQSARGDGKTAFAADWSESVRVLLPFGRFFRKAFFDLTSGQLFPTPMRDLAQSVP